MIIEPPKFCAKMKLLLWKNFHVVVNNKACLIIAIIFPLLLNVFIAVQRMTHGGNNREGITTYTTINGEDLINELNKILKVFEDHKIKAQKFDPNFNYSVFVPRMSIAFASDDREHFKKFELALKHHNVERLKPVYFSDCDSLREVMQEYHYFAGICINRKVPLLDYDMIFPAERRIKFETIGDGYATASNFENRVSLRKDIENLKQANSVYLIEGGLAIQVIMTAMFKSEMTDEQLSYFSKSIEIGKMPYVAYSEDLFSSRHRTEVSQIVALQYLFPTIIIFNMIIKEKSNAVRTYLKLKGIGLFEQNLAWVIVLWLLTSFNSFISILFFKIGFNQGESLMEHASYSAIFYIMTTYCFTNACFCVMVSGLTSSNKHSTKVIFILWILFFIWYYSAITLSDLDYGINIAHYFMYNSLFANIIDFILAVETFADGFGWYYLFKIGLPFTEAQKFTFALLVTAGVFFALSFVFDQFSPGLYGQSCISLKEFFQKWLWGSKKGSSFFEEYWTKRFVVLEGGLFQNHSYGFSLDTSGLLRKPLKKNVNPNKWPPSYGQRNDKRKVPIIQISNLSKKFGKIMCADDIWLNIYHKEATVLMGSNGCGKTVFAGMLAGFIQPDKGSIFINGFSLKSETKKAFQDIGLAYENQLLIEDLTFKQQLIFHARVKGVPPELIDDESYHDHCEDLQLDTKYHVLTKNLCYAHQNQLALLCALCGNSKIILLDSVDFDLDAKAGNYIIQLINQLKHTHTIFITSNRFNFVEHVADNIYMISNGEVICSGSLSFLKETFGNQYFLVCYKTKEFRTSQMKALQEIVERTIPNIRPENQSFDSVSVTYIIERRYAPKISEILREIEDKSNELCIKTIYIKDISLKDIFYKIDDNQNRLSTFHEDGAADLIRQYIETSNTSNVILQRYSLVTGMQLFWQRVKGFKRRQWLLEYNCRFITLVLVLVPIIFMTLPFIRSSCYNKLMANPRRAFDITKYKSPSFIISVPHIDRLFWANDRVTANTVWFVREGLYENKVNIIDTLGEPVVDYVDNQIQQKVLGKILPRLIGALTRHKIKNTFPHLVVYYNNLKMHTAPTTLNLATNALLKSLKGEGYSIRSAIYPLPFQENITNFDFTNLPYASLCMSLGIIFAMGFSYFEFSSGSEKSRIILGSIRGAEFWIATFLSMLVKTVVLAVIYNIIGYGIPLFHYSKSVFYLFIAFIFLSCTYVTYFKFVCGYFIRKENFADLMYRLNLICGLILFFAEHNSPFQLKELNPYYFFLPIYVIAKSLNSLFFHSELKKWCKMPHIVIKSKYINECKTTPNCCDFKQIIEGVKDELMIMIAINVLWFIIIAVFENLDRIRDCLPCFQIPLMREHKNYEPKGIYGNKSSYSMRSSNFSLMQNADSRRYSKVLHRHPIVCTEVGKRFKKHVAVLQQSLTVLKGECFVIVGPNESGKSALLRMISRSLMPSYGQVQLYGYDIHRERKIPKISIGFCSEKINFPDDLTVVDVMETYALIIGVSQNIIKNICSTLAKYMNIATSYHLPLKYCSLGTQKRLMFLLSLMGNPRIVLLDCPLHAVDVVGREVMAKLVSQYAKTGGTVLMTVSDIGNVDEFADRVGVMSQGQMKLIGSLANLSNFYTYGYALRIKIHPRIILGEHLQHRSEKILSRLYVKLATFIETRYEGAGERGEYGRYSFFFIPKYEATLEEIFEDLIDYHTELNIGELHLTTNTLQYIFEDYMDNFNVRRRRNAFFAMNDSMNNLFRDIK